MQQSIADFTQQLLAHMGIDEPVVEVEEQPDHVFVNLKTDEQQSGMLIGYHGETIASLQKVISLSFRADLGTKKIVVNINDYKQKREGVLEQMALRYAQKAIETSQPQALPFLPANERLVVHMTLKDHDQVETRSEGEGNQRRLVIYLKS